MIDTTIHRRLDAAFHSGVAAVCGQVSAAPMPAVVAPAAITSPASSPGAVGSSAQHGSQQAVAGAGAASNSAHNDSKQPMVVVGVTDSSSQNGGHQAAVAGAGGAGSSAQHGSQQAAVAAESRDPASALRPEAIKDISKALALRRTGGRTARIAGVKVAYTIGFLNMDDERG